MMNEASDTDCKEKLGSIVGKVCVGDGGDDMIELERCLVETIYLVDGTRE